MERSKSKSRKPVTPPIKDTFNDDDWVKAKWRPMMAWQYIATCTCDFIIFPILYSAAQALYNGTVSEQWHPITLEGAGFYHVAMGAILGISAYSRGRERMVAMETFDFSDLDHDGIPDEEQADPTEDIDPKQRPKRRSRAD